ncbi:phage antirepressor [Lactiplantibacillus mudanjiangensis]|uniref:Phage repressor protein/antirepressor Ant [Lactobacillus plantarum subsp. plantarum] n=1 Tax=Lactiplantibacillus mudanjiangensis TaxID=1296538 RepID=A0A660DZ98_9LACO|nr:phage antirepressor KilAC domain-containing protein [Lactiplantibacillus mudanjiangensis]VDG25853.1 phage repressor protein/antirepressor Ant [Lactobacillus plantarum subsp. plantarum] [Lactiplantibacillus mudanjiangensis]VDG28718.1 phage repressor protein/antirepressor Ant [Lactobacillus plantarum subsp. plantarum] [Lactiplantibacillus mudanjiangensis]
MNQITPFNFEGNQVRTVLIGNEPYFVGKDVATLLGYKNTKDALSKHVNDNDKLGSQVTTSGQSRSMTVINESGVYDLIFDASRQGKNTDIRHKATVFRHWVTNDVLPSIRKNGVYMTDQTAYDITHDKDALGDLLLKAGSQLKQKDLVIQELKPKALFADSVATSKTTILVGDLAKILKGNGVDTGQNRLFEELRNTGFLISRKGVSYNMPTQLAMDMGLFVVKETAIQHSDGHVTVNKTPKVTGKGQQYFVNKYLQDKQPA